MIYKSINFMTGSPIPLTPHNSSCTVKKKMYLEVLSMLIHMHFVYTIKFCSLNERKQNELKFNCLFTHKKISHMRGYAEAR